MKFLLTFLLIVLSTSAYAEEPRTMPPMALEQQEQVGNMQRLMGAVDEAEMLLNRVVLIERNNCMMAIGVQSFCECITNKLPMSISFANYVVLISKTKSELKYNELSNNDKELIDNIRKARDQCVNWKDKSN